MKWKANTDLQWKVAFVTCNYHQDPVVHRVNGTNHCIKPYTLDISPYFDTALIYSVDSTIHPLNNWGKEANLFICWQTVGFLSAKLPAYCCTTVSQMLANHWLIFSMFLPINNSSSRNYQDLELTQQNTCYTNFLSLRI